MQESADLANRYNLPVKTSAAPRAAPADLYELQPLDEAEDTDEVVRAMDPRTPDRNRNTAPRSQPAFSSAKGSFQGPPRNDPKVKTLMMCYGEFRLGADTCKKPGCQYSHRGNFGSQYEYDRALLNTLAEQYEALASTPIMQKLLAPEGKSLRDELLLHPSLVEAMRRPLSVLGPLAQAAGPKVVARHSVAFAQSQAPEPLHKEPYDYFPPLATTEELEAQLQDQLHIEEGIAAMRAAGSSPESSSS